MIPARLHWPWKFLAGCIGTLHNHAECNHHCPRGGINIFLDMTLRVEYCRSGSLIWGCIQTLRGDSYTGRLYEASLCGCREQSLLQASKLRQGSLQCSKGSIIVIVLVVLIIEVGNSNNKSTSYKNSVRASMFVPGHRSLSLGLALRGIFRRECRPRRSASSTVHSGNKYGTLGTLGGTPNGDP